MCGIAGIFNLNGQGTIDSSVLQEMNQAQFHRGPDEGPMDSTRYWAGTSQIIHYRLILLGSPAHDQYR